MDPEKTKRCAVCKKEFPATNEYFGKRTLSSDGFEYRCKKCKNRYDKNYRKGEDKPAKKKTQRTPANRPIRKEPLITASPEAIIAALRKGMAREIITLIQDKFGTV